MTSTQRDPSQPPGRAHRRARSRRPGGPPLAPDVALRHVGHAMVEEAPKLFPAMTSRSAAPSTPDPSDGPHVADAHQLPRDGVDRVEMDWRRERPDIDVSSFGIVTRIWRIARHLDRQRTQQLAGFNSDRGTMDILAMLRRSGAPYRRTAGALTRSALITSGGVSQRLDKLERAGLITRHVDTGDRRRVDVELTEQGVDLVDSVLTDLMDHDTAVLAAALDDHEQETLRRLLRKLLLSLEPVEDDA